MFNALYKSYLFVLFIAMIVCFGQMGCAASVTTPVVAVAASVPVEPPGTQTLEYRDHEPMPVRHQALRALPMPRNSQFSCGYTGDVGALNCEQGKLSLR